MPERRTSSRLVSKSKGLAAKKADPEPAKKRAKSASATASSPATQPDKKPETEAETESTSKEIQIGDPIPDTALQDQDEITINLKKAAAETKYVVIFAYPKASTPGCTRQACGFQKNSSFLHSNDVTVFGLSADLPKSQKSFAEKQGLEYPLLSDPSRELIGVLGAKKTPLGIKRSHWIFVDGVLKVKKIQISPEASIDGAKEDIEQFIKEQKKE